MSFKNIRVEAIKLRDKYNPQSVADLEKLANVEYGVRIIPTPYHIRNSKTGCREDGLPFIIYPSIRGEEARFSLAHEIGHSGARHFVGDKMRQKVIAEIEADVFASTLLGMGYLRYFLSKTLSDVRIGYDRSGHPEKYPKPDDAEFLRIGTEIARGYQEIFDEKTLREVGRCMTN